MSAAAQNHSLRYLLRMLTLIILMVLIALVVGALPAWPHARGWGYYPSGFGMLLVVLFLIWLFYSGAFPQLRLR